MTSGSSHGDTGEGGSVLGRVIWLSLCTDTRWQSKQLLGLTSLQLILPWGMILVWFLTQCEQLIGYFKMKISWYPKKFPKYEKNAQRRILYWDKAWAGNASPSSFPPHVPSLELLQVFRLRNWALVRNVCSQLEPLSHIQGRPSTSTATCCSWVKTCGFSPIPSQGNQSGPIWRGSSTWVSF